MCIWGIARKVLSFRDHLSHWGVETAYASNNCRGCLYWIMTCFWELCVITTFITVSLLLALFGWTLLKILHTWVFFFVRVPHLCTNRLLIYLGILETFQNTNLVHILLIFNNISYITLLNMFRAARCSSSGGPIVSPQPLVSSPSVSSRTACRWRADWVCSPPAYCTAVYRGWRYQRLWSYNWSSWWWAACCSKHVEECNVTYIVEY